MDAPYGLSSSDKDSIGKFTRAVSNKSTVLDENEMPFLYKWNLFVWGHTQITLTGFWEVSIVNNIMNRPKPYIETE